MIFKTYGPYAVTTWDEMSNLFKERGEPPLEHAAGIYIFFQEIRGKLVPLYVGQTRTHFGERVASHMNNGKVEVFKRDKNKLISVLFIALVKPSGRLKSPSLSDRKFLDKLEFMLIGASLLKNQDLCNSKHKRFHESLKVPGYLNYAEEELDGAGLTLNKLLIK